MKDFLFKSPTKILFGEGVSAKIGDVCKEFGATKIFIVSDPIISQTPPFKSLTENLKSSGFECVIYTDTVPEPPIEVIDKVADALKESKCEMLVAVGGGSPIDTAKAVSMLATNEGSVREYLFGGTKTVQNKPLPLICVPTTAGSGSEVTGASVITDTQNDIKLSVTHEYIIPKYAVVDPLMQVGMPQSITSSTGMDALTHAIEAYVSLNSNIVSDAYAEKAMSLIGESLYTATYNPTNIEARSKMALASVLGATAFVNGGLGAVHGISQAMGGVAHVPHGVANAMMLPYVIEKNVVGNLEKFANIARLLGADMQGKTLREQAQQAVYITRKYSDDLGIPKTLKEVGVTREMFPAIVKRTMEYRMLALNPVKLKEKDVYDILEKAYE